MNEKLKINTAQPDDAKKVISILDEATVYKNSQSDTAWGDTPWSVDEIIDSINSGNRYLAYIDTNPVGSFVLNGSDENWDDNNQDSAFVHQLAIKNSYRSQDIGSQLLEQASNIAKQQGKKLLRLDCSYDNKKLCDYYARNGFSLYKVIQSDSPPMNKALFQKIL